MSNGESMDAPIVLSTSQEAAQYRTDVKGWVSRDGLFYGDGPGGERTARYAGCTHVPCGRCSKPIRKPYTLCPSCRATKEAEMYAAMPRASWDGTAMLYSKTLDRYYSDLADAEDELEEGQSLEDLRLVICKPNYVPELDSDYCCDRLPEDGDVPDTVAEAMEAFNKAVAGVVLSWSPGKFALALSDPNERHANE